MKLERFDLDPRDQESRLRELTVLLDQPSSREVRPCRGCMMACPCSGSQLCTCLCSPRCPQAPAQMSSEGDRYPLEPGVVGLVFAYACLRVCPSYWSCEGHFDQQGGIQRLPQVWFYSPSPLYPRLIADSVAQLHIEKRTVHPWHVCVTYAEEGLHTGFSLEPDAKAIPHLDLPLLRSDMALIADRLVSLVRERAQNYLDRYRHRVS